MKSKNGLFECGQLKKSGTKIYFIDEDGDSNEFVYVSIMTNGQSYIALPESDIVVEHFLELADFIREVAEKLKA